MALTHAVSTNNYGPAHLIVSTSAANGTHTTLAGAMADAVSGDTIFLRDSVTENVTLTAGVNITAWTGGSLNVPSITGTLTMTAAGTCNISGIRLVTNSAALLAVTGTLASIVNLNNCYLNCSNNTGITFSTSSASAQINISYCKGDLGTTGIALFSHSSAGTLLFLHSDFSNSGASTTANTASAGIAFFRQTTITNPTTTSSTNFFTGVNSAFSTQAQNVTTLTLGGSLTQELSICYIHSGSASAISVGSSATVFKCDVQSSNTNAITGAGTISYSDITFTGTSSIINTTTQNYSYTNLGSYKATGQPAFSALIASTDNNVTGDDTLYTVGTNVAYTVIYDIGSNFNTNGTFTAPVTGKYLLTGKLRMGGLTAAMTFGDMTIKTTARQYIFGESNSGVARTVAISADLYGFQGSCIADMTAGDTAILQIKLSGGTKVADLAGATPNMNCFFQGILLA